MPLALRISASRFSTPLLCFATRPVWRNTKGWKSYFSGSLTVHFLGPVHPFGLYSPSMYRLSAFLLYVLSLSYTPLFSALSSLLSEPRFTPDVLSPVLVVVTCSDLYVFAKQSTPRMSMMMSLVYAPVVTTRSGRSCSPCPCASVPGALDSSPVGSIMAGTPVASLTMSCSSPFTRSCSPVLTDDREDFASSLVQL